MKNGFRIVIQLYSFSDSVLPIFSSAWNTSRGKFWQNQKPGYSRLLKCSTISSNLMWVKVWAPCQVNKLSSYLLHFWKKYVLKFSPGLKPLQFSSVQSLSHVWLFATPWIAARQASLSITNSRSSLKFTSIKSVMPSSHLILYRPLLLLPPFPPSIRVFSNESTLCMRWPKYWSFSFSIIPSKEHPGLFFPPSVVSTTNH